MTLSSNPAFVQYAANGSSTIFGVSFGFEDAADVGVLITSALGVNAPQVLDSDYAISGFNVVFFTAPAAGVKITLTRAVALEQADSFPGDEVPQKAFELSLDRVVSQVQQLKEIIDRCVKLPAGTLAGFSATAPTAVGNGGNYLRVTSNALGIEWAAVTGGGGGGGDGIGIVSINGVSNDGGAVNLVAGSNITLSANTGAKTITIDASLAAAVSSVNGATGAVSFAAGTAIGISGTTINFDASGLVNDSISGNKVDGGSISNFASTGIDDNATGNKLTIDDTRMVSSLPVRISSTIPTFDLFQSDGGTNEKYSTFIANGTTVKLQFLNDSYASGVDVLSLTRSGTTATAATLTATAIGLTGATTITGTATITGNVVMSAAGSLTIPAGNTAARPGTPVNGMVRYNSQTTKFEGRENGAWVNMINTAAGEINTASNVGGGDANIFKQKSTYDLQFKTLVAGSNITLTDGTDTITFAASGTSGEINTASNVTAGGGVGLFKTKSSVDLQFKSLLAGAGISITSGTSDVTIASTAYVYNVKDPAYGALGDGSTDDTAAINLAIAALLVTGGLLYFPRGMYIITDALTPLTMTFTGTLHGENIDSRRVSVRGDGPGCHLRYSGSNPGSMKYLLDIGNNKTGLSSGGRDHWSGLVKDLWIDCTTASGIATLSNITGLRLFRMGGFSIQGLTVYGLGVGVQLHSSLSGNFINCDFRVNQYGVLGDNHADGFSSCNAINFISCKASANTLGGVRFTNGSFSWNGGNVEGNGQNGGTSAFGLRYIRDNNQMGGAPTGITICGDTYFESNGSASVGKADIWITQTQDTPVMYPIRDATFNRIMGQYCTNCILIESNFNNILGFDIDACGFGDYGFSPSLSQKYVNVTSTTANGRNGRFGINVYGDLAANPASANALPDFAACVTPVYQGAYYGSFGAKLFTPPRKGAKVYRTSNQTINHATSTALTFQTALYDDGVALYGAAIWNGGTKFIIPAGVTEARFTAQTRWNANVSGSRTATIKQGGGGFPCQPQNQVGAAGFTANNLTSDWLPVSAGQEYELYGTQDSGSALDILGSANSTTYFSVEFR